MAEYAIKRKTFTHKPIKVVLKRKNFGLGDGLGNAVSSATNAVVDTTKQVAGGAMNVVGDVAQTGVAKVAGGLGGAKLGATLGSTFGPLGTAIGAIGGYFLGKKATASAGKALSNAGQNLQMS